MKPQKVRITHYTRSVIASIQYAKGFALEVIRLIEIGSIITIEKQDFKL